jgi:hypothetical protein
MKFQITGKGWRVRSVLVASATIVDVTGDDHWAKGLTPPINATPLDDEAWQAQLRAYPDQKHLLGGGWQ